MNADDRLSLASLGRVEGGDGIVESRDVADVSPQSTIPHPLDDLTQLGAIGYDDEVDSQAARGPRLGRVEGGDGIVESRDVADVSPQSTIPHPLDDLTQLGAIGYDDEVDSQAARGPRLGRAGDGHQRSSGANQVHRPLPDVAADDIENQIDFADLFQGFVIEVDELLCAEVESRLPAASAPGADDVRAGLTCELSRHRTDYAGGTVHEDGLPRTKAAVLEQPLDRKSVV